MRLSFVHALALVQLASASPLTTRDTVTAQVNFNNNTGTPQHLASGLLYGVPDTQDQIPVRCLDNFIFKLYFDTLFQAHFYQNIGYNYERAGGAQVAAPGRGWIWGFTEYQVRKAHYSKVVQPNILLRTASNQRSQITRQHESLVQPSSSSFTISGAPMEPKTPLLRTRVTMETGRVGMRISHSYSRT
jgi:hypothetical protein